MQATLNKYIMLNKRKPVIDYNFYVADKRNSEQKIACNT